MTMNHEFDKAAAEYRDQKMPVSAEQREAIRSLLAEGLATGWREATAQ
jgi:hypothetical protein